MATYAEFMAFVDAAIHASARRKRKGEKKMATYPCATCNSQGPMQVTEALREKNPAAPACPACGSPVDGKGKTLEAAMASKS
jgi:DNA-directed RNA polymerase subunit RPC12/RpoP